MFLCTLSARMFVNRVPHMLDNDYTPKSALDIFVKDLVRLTRVSPAAPPAPCACALTRPPTDCLTYMLKSLERSS